MDTKDSHAANVLATLEKIVEDAMMSDAMLAHRRRIARDLAQCPMDEQAFAEAVDEFDHIRQGWKQRGYRDEHGRAQMMRDLDLEALQAFIATYLMVAGR